jgi:hypothetical protein
VREELRKVRRLQQLISKIISTTLIFTLFNPLTFETPAHSLANNECLPITDADANNGYDSGNIKITPLHGQVFYVDLKNGINAAYVGYEIRNDSASAINELWLEVSDFRSSWAVKFTELLLIYPLDHCFACLSPR